ncbi:MAG: Fe-S cluster assembly protein SufD [Bacteroidetes bacterium]|nr:Fe-S cluster assembly protein SufD [Bacteroidota bacterium]
MILEKTQTHQRVIEQISVLNAKVDFMNDTALSNALTYLEEKGIPNNKNEEYKYCNIDSILKTDFKNIQQQFNTVSTINNLRLNDCLTLVVVNGNFSEKLSDKLVLKGVKLFSFNSLENSGKQLLTAAAKSNSDSFIALNTAFSGIGFHLKILKNEQTQIPIQILYINSASAESFVNPRNIIELEENSSATIIEHYINIGTHKVFTNFVSEKYLAQNSNLKSYTLQNETSLGYGVYTNQVKVNKHANYQNTTVTLSGRLVRNNHQVILSEDNCEASLFGLFKTSNNQLVDNHTLIDHQKPNCQSNELYKGIIGDKSTGVFNGKIFVRKDAQKTNAYQSSKNVLLSDEGCINTKPQLEIFADDVKCSHGTSTGKIDENALFYLNARGLGKESAKKLLLSAFANEVIDKIEVDSLKEIIESQII